VEVEVEVGVGGRSENAKKRASEGRERESKYSTPAFHLICSIEWGNSYTLGAHPHHPISGEGARTPSATMGVINSFPLSLSLSLSLPPAWTPFYTGPFFHPFGLAAAPRSFAPSGSLGKSQWYPDPPPPPYTLTLSPSLSLSLSLSLWPMFRN
jgi:hypothetical protein